MFNLKFELELNEEESLLILKALMFYANQVLEHDDGSHKACVIKTISDKLSMFLANAEYFKS